MLGTLGFCGLGQILDLLLLPDALTEANRHLDVAKNELGVSTSSSPATGTVPTKDVKAFLKSVPVSMPSADVKAFLKSVPVSMPSAQDDELDQLLRQAEQSVNRINNPNEDS
jgi:hypothetical protein